MTVDTATLRAQAMDDIDNMRHLTGRSDLGPREVIALLDALEAERERVRVLTEALDDVRGRICFMSGQASSTALHNAALDVIDAALATAGGEGATT